MPIDTGFDACITVKMVEVRPTNTQCAFLQATQALPLLCSKSRLLVLTYPCTLPHLNRGATLLNGRLWCTVHRRLEAQVTLTSPKLLGSARTSNGYEWVPLRTWTLLFLIPIDSSNHSLMQVPRTSLILQDEEALFLVCCCGRIHLECQVFGTMDGY